MQSRGTCVVTSEERRGTRCSWGRLVNSPLEERTSWPCSTQEFRVVRYYVTVVLALLVN